MVKFDTLPPLKKWIISNKYFLRVSDPKEKKVGATHLLLDGGIWKVPKEEYQNFLRILSVDLQNNEKYFMIAKKDLLYVIQSKEGVGLIVDEYIIDLLKKSELIGGVK